MFEFYPPYGIIHFKECVNGRLIMKRILYFIPALCMMIVIFAFSSKPADISGKSSMRIANKIYSVYEGITGRTKTEEERLYEVEILDHIVRKGAHVTEFALLAAAWAWPLSKSGLKGIKLALTAIGLTVLYAASDEYHQTFVPGRSGEIKDVCIDGIGALIGYFAFNALVFIRSKR